MKGKLFFMVGLFFLAVADLKGEGKDSIPHFSVSQKSVYSFIIQDSPARLFTMRQFDEDYLSGYRLYSKMMADFFSPRLNFWIQAFTNFAVFIPLTHEEGHRSILASKNIGSISQPFFLSKRGGYIEGVTDNSLIKLRDKDFPNFARLYTSGLESDYMLTHREESLLAFEREKFRNLAVEYLMRKAIILQYYLMGFVKYDVDGTEETDELHRDIVGNDVYGIVRHLHRPAMPFQRYTRYAELTGEETDYLKKMGYRSLLNLVNLNIIGIPNIRLSRNLSLNLGMGHTMCPFGDFIDVNLWIKYKKKLMIETYLRQFQNKGNRFPGGGIGVKDYPLTDKFLSSVNIHLWDLPTDLGFNDTKSKFGGAVEWVGKYFFQTRQKKQLRGISVDLGLIYKTAGFLPEEVKLQKHFGIRLGTSFALDK